MKNVRALLFAAIAGGLAGGASGQAPAQGNQGDTLDMRGADRSATFEAPGKPKRGMTKERVAAEFGEPSSRAAPVGEPPISRWDYPGFAVFFEYDRVIHAVSK